MTAAAWVFMVAIWAVILGNVGYCFWKLLTSERRLSAEEEQVMEEFHTP